MTVRSPARPLTQWSEILLSQCQLQQELAYTDRLLQQALIELPASDKSQGQGPVTRSLGVYS